jgi:hypothetical protein
MDRQLLKDSLGWGSILWLIGYILIGYILGIVRFFVLPPSWLGHHAHWSRHHPVGLDETSPGQSVSVLRDIGCCVDSARCCPRLSLHC